MIEVQKRETKTYTVEPSVVLTREREYEIRIDKSGMLIRAWRGASGGFDAWERACYARVEDVQLALEEWSKIK